MRRRHLVIAALLGAWLAASAGTVLAQTTPGPREGEVASDPIRCWWKADRTAVRIGERFGLVLTCAVIEAGEIVVVPALNQLEPGALSITPFEVVSGTRGDDVVAPPWRYVQFEYGVRLLSDGFFGQDVAIPGITVTYNLQTAGGTEGRDRTYQLPTLPMRILSLVPGSAADIRDASGQTFETIGARRFRASLALVAAVIAFAFAAVLVAFAVVQGLRRYRVTHAAAERALPDSSVLGGCLNALSEVTDTAARGGWTPELARRAAAALRVAGAVALGRPVAQTTARPGAQAAEGQLALKAGWWRPRRVVVSAPVTPGTIARHLQNGGAGGRDHAMLETIAGAIGTLTSVAYAREWRADAADLDGVVRGGRDSVRQLRALRRWPRRILRDEQLYSYFL